MRNSTTAMMITGCGVVGSDFTITYTSVPAPISGSSSPSRNSRASRSSTDR